MTKSNLVHVLQPGQQLCIRFGDAASQVLGNQRAMRLTPDGGNSDPLVHVTFVDDSGISLYIARGYTFGGDMEAFLPADLVMWQSYFHALNSFNHSYVRSAHFKRRFPADFV